MINKMHINNKNKLTKRSMTPEYITIHSTGNLKSSAKNERDNLNRLGNTTSTGFHYVVDEKEIIECIPPNKVAYHAGDGENGVGNSYSIGIEMCESGDRSKVINNTIRLVKYLMKKYNIPIGRIKRHYDWSGKLCPRILSTNNWYDWKMFINKLDDDVSEWAKNSWELAKELSIIDGTRPKDGMTREECITILDRMGGLEYAIERLKNK